jgi:hypothetical protein
LLVGISTNLSRAWPEGNHPGLVLARRLKPRPNRSGCSPPTRRCPGPTTPPNRR